MTEWHLKSRKKPTGGSLGKPRKKRKFQRGLKFLETRIDKRKTKPKRKRGGSYKIKLLSAQTANITDPSTKKTMRAKILSVTENPANTHYIRRNILTKGSIVKTEAGEARITSRPGQHGVINAVFVKKGK
jgi:small subunit ribosomal protein S8e